MARLWKQQLGLKDRGLIYQRLKQSSPLDGQAGVTVSLQPTVWQALLGHPRAAYGQKCTAADLAETLNTLPLQLLLALEPSTSDPIPSGSLALPSLILTAPQVAGIPNP